MNKKFLYVVANRRILGSKNVRNTFEHFEQGVRAINMIILPNSFTIFA